MPRKKETRNFRGSVITRRVTKNGKKATAYDARIRVPRRNSFGEVLKDEKGRTRYRDIVTRCWTSTEAQIALLNLITAAEAGAGSSPAGSSHTFHELADYYKREYVKPAVFSGDEQIAGFRQNYKAIETYVDGFKAYFGDIPLDALTFETIRSYAETLATTPVTHHNARTRPTRLPSPATINRKLSYLRRMLNIAKRLRWISSNPFNEGEALIKANRESARERVLTFEEEKRLLDVCVGDRAHLRLIVIMALDTALRKTEIFSLERRDIDLEEMIITLPARRTKALKTRRIAISVRLENELREYFARFAFHPSAKIFFGRKDADRAFATACDKAGIRDFKFHDLRHTATTWMDEAELSLAARKEMVGHADDRTHGRYHNLSVDVVRSAREKMELLRLKRAS